MWQGKSIPRRYDRWHEIPLVTTLTTVLRVRQGEGKHEEVVCVCGGGEFTTTLSFCTCPSSDKQETPSTRLALNVNDKSYPDMRGRSLRHTGSRRGYSYEWQQREKLRMLRKRGQTKHGVMEGLKDGEKKGWERGEREGKNNQPRSALCG